MKKILLTLGLLTITVLPVFATNWVLLDVNEQMYIDTTSVSKYDQIYGRNNIYSIWSKNLNNNTRLDQKLSTSMENVNSTLTMFLIDCNTKELAVKSGNWYDSTGQRIKSGTLNDYQLNWEPIIPGSFGEYLYNYACGGYR